MASRKKEVRIGPFVVLDELPGGTTTRLFRARYKPEQGAPELPLDYGAAAVIKLLKRDRREDALALARFNREAELLLMLDHPSIVRSLTRGMSGGSTWFASNYIEGESLLNVRDAFFKAGYRFQPQVALTLFSDIAEALSVAHELKDATQNPLGLVHRDLSPRNLMIDISGRTQLVDFGHTLLSSREQNEGSESGTLGYLSPEQARNEALTQASDVYTLGVLLFELVTGERAFDVEHALPMSALETHANAQGAPWPGSCDVSSRVRLIIDQCLSPDPSMRPQNAAELHGMMAPMVRDFEEGRRRLSLIAKDLVVSNRNRPAPLYI